MAGKAGALQELSAVQAPHPSASLTPSPGGRHDKERAFGAGCRGQAPRPTKADRAMRGGTGF